MSHFVTLSRYTQQGTARIKESPARLDAAKKAAEKEGGKIHAWYLTMGKYDAVIVSISGKSLGVRRPIPDRFGHLEVLHNAPSANFSIGVKPDYDSSLTRHTLGVHRKGECSKADKPGLEEGYFCGAAPILRRRFFSWSALQYLQSRRIKTDV
jgi:hypothetical protein